MSPTATIVTVVVALIFVAWLVQSDSRDPNYEAWLKRQQEAKRVETAQRASLGIAITEAGVTKDNPVAGSSSKEPGARTTDPEATPGAADPNPGGTGEPANPSDATRLTFGRNARLEGAYAGFAYADGVRQKSPLGEEPTITFRRDGSFTMQNMSLADVDIEAAMAVGTSKIDRGTGRYQISGEKLTLNYNDGLTRKKGNRREYQIIPFGGTEDAPTGITIQGKLFKLQSGGGS